MKVTLLRNDVRLKKRGHLGYTLSTKYAVFGRLMRLLTRGVCWDAWRSACWVLSVVQNPLKTVYTVSL